MSKPKYCVYDERIEAHLIRFSRQAYKCILDGQRRFPGVNFQAMISMVAHQAATVATNAAEGKPLRRRWRSKS